MDQLKLTSIFIYIFVALFGPFKSAFAASDTEEMVEAIKVIYKHYREAKKTVESSAVKEDLDSQMDICVECTDILQLTENINQIIDELADQTKSDVLKFEAGNLEAVRRYVEVIDENTWERSCEQRVNKTLNPEFANFDETALKLEFDAPLYQRFDSLQLRGVDGTRTVWLRGKDKDQLKFIKVQIIPGQPPHISIYSLPEEAYDDELKVVLEKPSTEEKKVSTKDNDQNEKEPEKDEKEVLDFQYEFQTGDEVDNFSIAIGPELEYKDYLPRHLTLLELKGETEVGEDFHANFDIAVNDRVQEGVMMLTDSDDKEYAKLRIDSKGEAKIRVPSP